MPSWCGIWRRDRGEWRIGSSEEGDSKCATPYSLLALSLLRLRRRVALVIHAQPTGRRQPLLRQIAALVVHLLRALDPVAEIDVRQPLAPGARDVVEDDEGAARAR